MALFSSDFERFSLDFLVANLVHGAGENDYLPLAQEFAIKRDHRKRESDRRNHVPNSRLGDAL